MCARARSRSRNGVICLFAFMPYARLFRVRRSSSITKLSCFYLHSRGRTTYKWNLAKHTEEPDRLQTGLWQWSCDFRIDARKCAFCLLHLRQNVMCGDRKTLLQSDTLQCDRMHGSCARMSMPSAYAFRFAKSEILLDREMRSDPQRSTVYRPL